MKFLPTFLLRTAAVVLCAAIAVFSAACNHARGRAEVAYVSGVQVNLRDHVAAVYEKTGVVKNGERVEVLDHEKRFAKVRTAAGQMGWMEQRFLVSQQVFDRLQKLTTDNENDPVQAQGVTRNDTNLHVEPGRETEHLYQIATGEKLTLLKRGTAEKSVTVLPRANTPPKPNFNEGPPFAKQSQPALEDWWLARDTHGRVGWVLARMVDLEAPLEVAQYAEGQRIVAFFVLNEVDDKDKDKNEKKVPQYLIALTEPKDGLPFDFNQIRVFTWNPKKHRYETAYRERMEGVLPITVSQENFDKEGTLPAFVVRVLDDNGNVSERKYKLNTPIVRRVYAPGEQPTHAAAKRPARKRAR